MKNSKLKKFILLIIISLSIFYLQTVAYSAMSSTLSITGNAMARVAADVRITGFRLASTNNGVSYYEEYGKNHVVTGIELANWMSSITYYVEVTNYGSSDVGIYSISGLPSGLTYTINNYTLKNRICDDTGKCNQMAKKTLEITIRRSSYTNTKYSGDIQLNFDFRPIYNVTYEGITNNNYPTGVIQGDNLSITFRENLNRVLFTSNGTQIGYYASITNRQTVTINNITSDIVVKQKPYVAKIVRGNKDAIGSEICIGDECFYIIASDSTTVKMISKYNLHVGWSVGNFVPTSETSGYASDVNKLTNPTGKQDPSALGLVYNPRDQFLSPWIGSIGFSSKNYWWNATTGNYNTGFSTDFTVDGYNFPYVYNSSSNMYTPFNNYKDYLESHAVEINDVRLAKGSELIALGCYLPIYSCLYAPDFIRSTTYWVGSAYDNYGMIAAPTVFSFWQYNFVDVAGARPVVEISKNEIPPTPNISSLLSIKSGDINTPGSEICIGSECFYMLYNDTINVTMISKYNLEVGYKVTGWNQSTNSYIKTKITNPSGKQSSSAIGAAGTYENPQFPFIGTVEFSPDYYWWNEQNNSIKTYMPHYYLNENDTYYWVYNNGSSVYQYIENYRKYLESLGVVINNARILSMSELNWIACNYSENCDDIPPTLYATSYWLGSASGKDIGGMFAYNGIDGQESYVNSQELLGVRPVISIPVGMFN